MADRRGGTVDLFAAEPAAADGGALAWPDAARFPVNADGRQVRDAVWQDLLAATEPLIVTGYAGIDHVIDYIAAADPGQPIRVLFGHEPFPSRREHYRLSDHNFTAEAEDYWLKRNISLTRSAALLRAIDALKVGRVCSRYLAAGHGRSFV